MGAREILKDWTHIAHTSTKASATNQLKLTCRHGQKGVRTSLMFLADSRTAESISELLQSAKVSIKKARHILDVVNSREVDLEHLHVCLLIRRQILCC